MTALNIEERSIILEADNQLADEITLLAGQLNAGECRFLKLIAEFDVRLGWAGAGIRSCAHWLNWKCGISMGTAREKIRSARALATLPEINDAFEKGELSYSKVRAMTRVATPENENYLMMIAEHGTAQHMEKLVKKYKRVKHLNELEEPEREGRDPREFRDVFCYQEDDGMWNITARLPAEEGGIVVKALNAIVDQLKASQDKASKNSRSNNIPSPKESEDVPAATLINKTNSDVDAESDTGMRPAGGGNVPAETFSADSDCESRSFESSSSEYPHSEKPLMKERGQPSMGQRRADALGAMAEHFLASGSSFGQKAGKGADPGSVTLKSLKGAERCQLILHVKSGFSSGISSSLYSNGSPTSGVGQHSGIGACGCGCDCDEKETDTLRHLDGQWVPPDVAKRLACDASFFFVEEDDAGNVLDIGRRSRIISPAMSRALAIRDGGCQFPGCCETRYVEGHHIIHWANGGETKMENLVTLCRYHHQELHRGSFFLTLLPTSVPASASARQKPKAFSERLVFTSGTNGFVIPRNPVNFSSSDYDFSKLQSELPESVDADTAVFHWTGEHMDYGMGVDGLLWADGWRA